MSLDPWASKESVYRRTPRTRCAFWDMGVSFTFLWCKYLTYPYLTDSYLVMVVMEVVVVDGCLRWYRIP